MENNITAEFIGKNYTNPDGSPVTPGDDLYVASLKKEQAKMSLANKKKPTAGQNLKKSIENNNNRTKKSEFDEEAYMKQRQTVQDGFGSMMKSAFGFSE